MHLDISYNYDHFSDVVVMHVVILLYVSQYSHACSLATGVLRLVDGVETSTTLSGRLEVFINGEWGTVCDDGWDINDAHVACRELGYSYALSYQCCSSYGRGSGRIWLDDVDCSGGENSLLSCPHRGIGVLRSCSHSEDVGMVCYRPGTVYTHALIKLSNNL